MIQKFGGEYAAIYRVREHVDGIMENAWKQLEWDAAARARSIALACRLDRQLEEVAGVASRPESRLAHRLRAELQNAAATAATTAEVFAAVEAIHEQLAYLPKPAMPTGVRVFLRDLFGRRWDDNVVVAAVARPRWPLGQVLAKGGENVPTVGGDGYGVASDVVPSPERPVTVIPRAEMRNPLMWPLIAVQGAGIVGWSDAEQRVRDAAGPGVWFALAEALVAAGDAAAESRARELWQRGCDELSAAGSLYEDALQLARSLVDGILISARRVGAEDAGGADIYDRLAAVRDVPAEAVEILSAGWVHWYGHAVPKLLAANDWSDRRAIVDGIDDVLCRSLDVAAIHRFYATEGASV